MDDDVDWRRDFASRYRFQILVGGRHMADDAQVDDDRVSLAVVADDHRDGPVPADVLDRACMARWAGGWVLVLANDEARCEGAALAIQAAMVEPVPIAGNA